MDRQAVPMHVDCKKKTSLKDCYYSVPERLDNIQVLGIPWDRIESTFVATLMDSAHHQSPTLTHLSLPSTSLHHKHQNFNLKYDYQSQSNGRTSKLKICESENDVDDDDDYDGVLVIDEDRVDEESLSPEMIFASPNKPQQVITEDQANGTSQLSLTNTRTDSTHLQSSTVNPLSLPSTSLHHNHQNFNLKCDCQSQADGTTSKRKICECEKEVYDDDDDYDSVLVIDEDRKDEESLSSEMRFASPNKPQQVITEDQANGTAQLSLTNNTRIDSTHLQSSTVTHLSLPSTSSRNNKQQHVISNYETQPTVNGQTSKRQLYEIGCEVEADDDDIVQWLDDGHENEESSPPVKKPRLDTTQLDSVQPKMVRQSQPSANCPTGKRKLCEIENEVKEDDDDDCDEWIDCDQENKDLFPPVKKPRMDTTRPDSAQPMVVRQSVRPAENKQQKEVTKQDGQVITLALQCPEGNCLQMFTTNEHKTALDQLNHLKNVHSIGLHRCMVLYCAESFNNHNALGQHIKQFHAGIDEWHCSKCPSHLTSYRMLSQHTIRQHQLGQFECSFSDCTFTAECKEKVVNHYANLHRVKPELVCQAKSGCHYRTTNSGLLKDHERAHLGIKPFRCTWPNCGHSSARRTDTIRHIQRIHISTSDLAGQPTDYLSVDHSLL